MGRALRLRDGSEVVLQPIEPALRLLGRYDRDAYTTSCDDDGTEHLFTRLHDGVDVVRVRTGSPGAPHDALTFERLDATLSAEEAWALVVSIAFRDLGLDGDVPVPLVERGTSHAWLVEPTQVEVWLRRARAERAIVDALARRTSIAGLEVSVTPTPGSPPQSEVDISIRGRVGTSDLEAARDAVSSIVEDVARHDDAFEHVSVRDVDLEVLVAG